MALIDGSSGPTVAGHTAGEYIDPLGLTPLGQGAPPTIDPGQAYQFADAEAMAQYEKDLAAWQKRYDNASVFAKYGLEKTKPQKPAGNVEAFVMPTTSVQQYGMGGTAGGYVGRQIDPAVQNMLMAQATGAAPSAAQITMEDAVRRNQAAAMSMAQSNPNVAPALAMRMAMNAQNQMGMQSLAQVGAMRAQEQARGQAMLSDWMQNQQGKNDQMVQYFMSLGYTMDEAQMKASMALEGMKMNAHENQQARNMAAQGAAVAQQQAQNTAMTSTAGAVAGAMVGGPGGASAGSQIGAGMGQQSMDTPGGGMLVTNANEVQGA